MKKIHLLTAAAIVTSLFLTVPSFAGDKAASIGVVDFAKCIMDSKPGKKEQENYETLKVRMQKAVEDLDAQMSETATKLQDKDLLDSLSPEAEQELRVKFQTLGEEMQRYQGQFYQVMQQANMKLMQTMHDLIEKAADDVAKSNKLTLIINKDAAFHYSPSLEITDKIISSLDKKFENEASIAKSEDTASLTNN